MSTAVIRVFAADAHCGLAQLLDGAADVQVVGQADSEDGARSQILALRPDVVIVVVGLHGGSGIELCREITSQLDVAPAFLIITADDEDEILFAAITAGAAGFLLRGAAIAEVLAAVRTLAAGRSMIDPELVTAILTRVRRTSPPDRTREVALSDPERRILNMIAAGLSNRQIGDQLFVTEKTVKNYLSVIFRKLGVSSRTQAVRFMGGFGDDVALRNTSSTV